MDLLKQLYEALLLSPFFRIIIFLLIVLILLKLYFKRRVRVYSDIDLLYKLSRKRECSEYDIFRAAADLWNFSEKKVDEDFKRYLNDGDIPKYVKDFMEKEARKEGL